MTDLLTETKNTIVDIIDGEHPKYFNELFEEISEVCSRHNSKMEYYEDVPKIINVDLNENLTSVILTLNIKDDHYQKIQISSRRTYDNE